MFTGIISHSGSFKGWRRGKKEIMIQAPSLSSKLDIGESLAVNGVCLSLVKKQKNFLFFSLSEETLAKTNLGHLLGGEILNLELPLTLNTPLGGHLVTGHVDGQGKVEQIINKNRGKRLTISFPSELKAYFIPQGSVAVNGVSLTIAYLSASSFQVELIPITLKNTNLGSLKRGDKVNLECDIIGKYVYNWLREIKNIKV
ncbi:MAG: riboflavin synthase [Candidatus Aminicenantales bacterium]